MWAIPQFTAQGPDGNVESGQAVVFTALGAQGSAWLILAFLASWAWVSGKLAEGLQVHLEELSSGFLVDLGDLGWS